MTVKEYLELIGKRPNSCDSLTFVIAKAVEDGSGSYTFWYRETPIRCIYEWLAEGSKTKDYYVLNENHPPIDWGSNWLTRYNRGDLKCMLVVSKEDWALRYSEEQCKQELEWIDKGIRERVAKNG
jgi:hypothetical protein